MALHNVERDTETLIDRRLKNLSWVDDPQDAKRNVFKQKPKTEGQARDLDGKRPDYILYRSDTDTPIAVIEAKKQGANIHKAMEQGVDYAQQLKAPIVFASDGAFTKTLHVKVNKPLLLNEEEVDDFIEERLLLRYLDTPEVSTLGKKVLKSRGELITIFSKVNDLLREVGLQQGIDRFSEFANLLFLKVLSELEAIKEEKGQTASVDKAYRWEAFRKKEGKELLSYINDTVLKQFNSKYKDEDLFRPLKKLKKKPANLKEIIDLLDGLQLSDVNADVKGDAFEYFIHAYSASNPSDLGEIFTPRHIVKTMVRLLNPRVDESIYDPFCGTGGMLIMAFKHVMGGMAPTSRNLNHLRQEALYGDELTKTASIAKMNMILAGDGHNNILEEDSFENPVDGKHDVVITNYPFAQKTRCGDKYAIKSRNGDIICPQHCLRALKEGGRMAFIAPEGLLFNNSTAHKQVRQYLLEHAVLKRVISLPAGAFQPHNGVKTSILYFTDCHVSKTKSHFWYFDVKNPGYTLGAKPKKIPGPNDLERVLSEQDLDSKDESYFSDGKIQRVALSDVKENNYVLYPKRETAYQHIQAGWQWVKLEEVCKKFEYGYTANSSTSGDVRYVRITDIQEDGDLGREKVYVPLTEENKKFILKKGDILVARIGSVGKSLCFDSNEASIFASYLIRPHFDQSILLPDYLKYCLRSSGYWKQVSALTSGAVQPQFNAPALKQIRIPLPPLVEQQAIVEELEAERKLIEANKALIKRMEKKIASKLDALWQNEKKEEQSEQ